jgi:Tol biopolymer transport system component
MSGGCNLRGDVHCEMEHFKGGPLSVAFDEPIAHPRHRTFQAHQQRSTYMLLPNGLPRLVLAFTAGSAALSCGGDGPTPPPGNGTLQITTATSGAEPDGNGYALLFDGTPGQAIGAAETVVIPEVTSGNHSVQLSDVAPNCTVSSDNPQSVSVTGGETATISFAVTCSATTGSLTITSATSGPATDPDGYTVAVDGANRGALGGNGAVTLSGLQPGSRTVGLSSVAVNCQIQGDNLREVTIAAGASASVAYTINCAPPPPRAGTLRITTATSGLDADLDGYTLALDGGAGQPVPLNGVTTVPNLAPGDHTVLLGGIADNCSAGTNPRSVTVAPETTTDLNIAINCSTVPSSVRVSVTVSGSPPDPDGFVAKLDAAEPGTPILTDGSALFTGVAAGSHTVALSGVAAHCSVTEGALRSVTVVAGAELDVPFAVTCGSSTGSIQVTSSTTGANLDSDGYTLTVDIEAAQDLGSNATLALDGLSAGTHVLALTGVAGNCHLDGENPRTVEVVPGATPAVTFAVSCLAGDALIAFGSNAFRLQAIFVVNPDGSGARNLTAAGAFERSPVWSPDGRRMLFLSDDDLYVMNADGSGRTLVTAGQPEVFSYRWSPDGRRIAFTYSGLVDGDFFEDLWVMQADGSNQIKLAANGGTPSWSPDGRRIAYEGGGQIRIVTADGLSDVRVTNQPFRAFDPAWSPDGTQIAFVTTIEVLPDRPAPKHIFLIRPDGTGSVDLSQTRGDDESPTWSPDGSKIAFEIAEEGNLGSEVAVMNRDGSGRVNLTNRPGFDLSPDWSPEGSKIVFHRSDNFDGEIYVMNADGSGPINVSNRPETDESTPDWGGQGQSTIASRQSVSYAAWLRTQALRIRQLQR